MDKLAVLNKLEVIDSSCHDETCEYVLVEDTEENREVLKELGADEADIKNMKFDDNCPVLDISQFAFNQLDAGWYKSDSGFSYDEH